MAIPHEPHEPPAPSALPPSPASPALVALAGALAAALASLVALNLCRLDFLWRFAQPMWQDAPGLVRRALGIGLQFDVKLLAGLLILAGAAWLVARSAQALIRRRWGSTGTPDAGRWARAAGQGALFVGVALLSVVQVGYFDFYQSAFSPIVFGFFEDDTVGVLRSIWSDYPVLLMLAAVAALTGLQALLARALRPRLLARLAPLQRRPLSVKVALAALTLLMLALAARGSLGTFPLRSQDAAISNHAGLNSAVMNAPYALYVAWSDRSEQVRITPDSLPRRLQQFGFRDLAELQATLQASPSIGPGLMRRSAAKPAGFRPPHVVVVLMESWSGYLLQFDDPARNDLLGALRPHLQRDLLFTHLASAEMGTHPALEHLLLNSPISPLTQGRQGDRHYRSAAAGPFKAAGYRTVFLYGGSGAWRRMTGAMRQQDFDATLDMGAITARYPDAVTTAWGVHDEYLFRFARETLEAADARGERLFLFVLTTSNHPPHEIQDKDRVRGGFDAARFGPAAALPPADGDKLLQTYHYANEQLGRFLDGLATGPLAPQTVVAATGDHNIRTFFAYRLPDDLLRMTAVPLLLHLPSAYLPQPATPEQRRRWTQSWAGQDDLFPTLYELALPATPYPALGRNLLAEPAAPAQALSINAAERVFGDFGALTLNGLTQQCFTWRTAPSAAASAPIEPLGGLQPAPCSPPHLAAARQARARLAWKDHLIRRQALGLPLPDDDRTP
jgi:phosphoglycerol transferase MdoB-like AlkP superfamily enzyme